MKWIELKRKQEAPNHGWILAYAREGIIFHPYSDYTQLDMELKDKELLEVHLFDRQKEYRCLSTRSSRFPGGIIETVEDFEESEEIVISDVQTVKTVYEERIKLLEERKEISVLNHLKYDETNGMVVIDNYRLKM